MISDLAGIQTLDLQNRNLKKGFRNMLIIKLLCVFCCFVGKHLENFLWFIL